ncbi:lipopolysaccharide 3-alpha-galactosyltransferase [Dryocola clanedunensis]|uniref:lipopolysaccharide 3-alpha-galactosyltransferase n=1 Tax=Cedecea sulfonylureivorans TaxID=3051154 RepID=UPI001925BDA9|nr:lipopolysaccharide 3-alpha-galactosyltransferase [Cedecea sulfonylureivorans]
MNQTYFNEKEVILDTLDYDYTESSQDDVFNISYGIDKNFLFGCGVSIASILLSNPHVSLAFHVFTDHFDEQNKSKFDALAAQYRTRIVVYLINCDKLKSLPSTKNWTYATYFRFIIADYFANRNTKLLYLDADIACQGSIQELVDLNFKDNEVAAVVTERNKDWWKKRSVTLGVAELDNGYFNAGFLLINIPAWTRTNVSEKAINMLKTPEVTDKITHLDQDVLNMLLVGQTRYIDKKFNTQYSLNYELKDTAINPVNESTVFIHYIGPTKPWHSWGVYPVSQAFLKAKVHSSWKNDPLLKPNNSNQYRYCAKHMFNKQKVLHGILNYFLYFVKKITN